MKEHVKAIVEHFLSTGRVDTDRFKEALRVGIRKRRKKRTDPEQRRKWREYYRKNRSRILRRARQWARKNKTALRQYAKKYRQMFGKREGREPEVKDIEVLRDKVEELISFIEEVDAEGTEELLSELEELQEMLDSIDELDEEEVVDVEEMLGEIEKAILGIDYAQED